MSAPTNSRSRRSGATAVHSDSADALKDAIVHAYTAFFLVVIISIQPSDDAYRARSLCWRRCCYDSKGIATGECGWQPATTLEVSAYLEVAKKLEGVGSDGAGNPHTVNEGIVIIDFGSQYSHLIARRIRELKVYSEIVPSSSSWESVKRFSPKGVILSGGPASVYAEGAPRIPDWVFEKRLPVLGICYGMQALVHQLGGKVVPGDVQEYGSAVLHQNGSDSPLFHGLPPSFQVWMSHGDKIADLPAGFSSLAYTENSPVAGLGNGGHIYGLQFHPEVNHTPLGQFHPGQFPDPHLRLRQDVDAG